MDYDDIHTMNWSLLEEKRKDREQRYRIEHEKQNREDQRTQELISAREYDAYERRRLEENKIANELQKEYARQSGELQREHYRGEIDLKLEKMRRERELAVENARHYSTYNVELLRQKGDMELAVYRERVALERENREREASILLESYQHHGRMAEIFANSHHSAFQKILETRASRTNSVLQRLEQQASLKREIFKLAVIYLLETDSDFSEKSMSGAIDEVLRHWKEL